MNWTAVPCHLIETFSLVASYTVRSVPVRFHFTISFISLSKWLSLWSLFPVLASQLHSIVFFSPCFIFPSYISLGCHFLLFLFIPTSYNYFFLDSVKMSSSITPFSWILLKSKSYWHSYTVRYNLEHICMYPGYWMVQWAHIHLQFLYHHHCYIFLKKHPSNILEPVLMHLLSTRNVSSGCFLWRKDLTLTCMTIRPYFLDSSEEYPALTFLYNSLWLH